MEAFLSNAIQGILTTGVDPGQIRVGCPDNALTSVGGVTRLHSVQIQVIPIKALSENSAELEHYSNFGSRSFTDVSWMKISFIRQLLELHPHVIYSDLDISWIRNPLPYLSQVAETYPIAFQTEALPRFPPAICCGFASFAKSDRTFALLDALITFHSTQIDNDERLDDQAACQRLIENDVRWLRDIFCLPEGLFLNGLGYRNLQNAGESPCPIEGELLPFLFHANWTMGIENKYRLLASTGTWLLDEAPQFDQATITPRRTQQPPPLLTVIYPIFDVRGDAVQRIQLWTQQQDLEPHRYRVLVVAGAAAELDEATLKKTLRDQDGILRIPGAGRDADYWNAGARAARTPWLLFVEAHGLPERDSLSALAGWIAANPDGAACNFRIGNLEGHRVAGLMKRWFAETHTGWAATSTWRRLHRTAFAIRRDVFEDAGPFEPEYGQFAPPLLSARMHDRGLAIAALPASGVMHDNSPEMSAHHDDTADYARGEMDARANNDSRFFEKYFGSSPFHGPDMILPARHARIMIRGLALAAWRRPVETFHLLKQALPFLPAALVSLRDRAKMLAGLTRADEYAVMHLPLAEETRWKRFLLAHHRVVRTEQMLWMARNPLPPLQIGLRKLAQIDTISQLAIVGLHALEHWNGEAFHWTKPAFLLRLAALDTKGTLTLETRNVGRIVSSSDIDIIVGGRVLPPEDVLLDDTGNIQVNIETRSARAGEIDVVVIVREVCEPPTDSGPGRRLGLPLFSIDFAGDEAHVRAARI